MLRAVIFGLAGLLSSLTAVAAAIDCENCEAWNQEQAPFQIFGNTYFVGVRGLSAVLITSPGGHVLIDGALPQSAPRIAQHVQQLGFKIEDVKLILNSHVHYDHAGGIAGLQKMTGAKVVASDIAAKVLQTGKVGRNDPQFEILKPYPPVADVAALGARKSVSVGKLQLNVIHTPGHTPGGTSWSWQSCEGKRCLNMVYGDSLNAVSDNSFKYGGDERYPNAASDMTSSIAALAAAPCDILVAAHPNLTGLWSVIDEHGKGDRAKLIDSSSCKRYAAAGKERLDKRLADEKLSTSAAAATPSVRPRELSESTLVNDKGLEYRILVSTPAGPPPANGFPAIYVLDGDAWFGAAIEIAKMREYSKLAPTVIVGVSYPQRSFFDAVRRSFDFTPPGTVDQDMKESGIALGGADEFLTFLNDKLKPQIRAQQGIDSAAEILFGHSLGGLFVLHALFTAPESFDVYLAASPSILFGDNVVLKREAAFLANPQRRAARVLITVGEFEYPKVSEPLKADYRRYYAAHPDKIPGQTPQQAVDDLFARRPNDRDASMAGDARTLAERLTKGGVAATFAYFPGEEHTSAAISALNRGVPFALRPPQ